MFSRRKRRAIIDSDESGSEDKEPTVDAKKSTKTSVSPTQKIQKLSPKRVSPIKESPKKSAPISKSTDSPRALVSVGKTLNHICILF